MVWSFEEVFFSFPIYLAMLVIYVKRLDIISIAGRRKM